MLEQLWHSKRGIRWAPRKRDMDPLDMVVWLGNLMVVAALDDGNDFLCRLYGTNLVQLFGRELTGRRVSSLSGAERNRFQGRLRSVLSERRPRHFRFEFRRGRHAFSVAELILPLTDDGETVSHLLIGAYPSP
jgi:hypothetical protein